MNASSSFGKRYKHDAATKFNPWAYPIFLLKLEYPVNKYYYLYFIFLSKYLSPGNVLDKSLEISSL